MIPQSETERILEEQLASRGLKVERTVTLESFSEQGSQVQAVLRKASGESETLTADWLVGCDGAHSTVRHGLGLDFEGTTQPSDWYLADGMISGLEPQDLLHLFWHSDGILAFFPIGGGRWRVIADLGPAKDGGHHADPTLEEVQALIAHRGTPGIVIKDPYWLAAFRINERKVSHYRHGPRLPGRRRRPHPQPGRRPGHEHRHAGRLQSCLEARPRDRRREQACAARQLLRRNAAPWATWCCATPAASPRRPSSAIRPCKPCATPY